MEKRLEFWAGRWEAGDAPWHKDAVNGFLMNHFNRAISKIPAKSCRVFVPLCGKSHDLKWIYDQGHSVVGVDGVEAPILDFFKEQGLCYLKDNANGVPCYSTEDGRLKIYHSDLFALNSNICGSFDAIWDRGSLVAIYHEDRTRYAALMKELQKEQSFYLIDTMVYDQSQYPGPPRSVPVDEIESLFGDVYKIEVLEDVDRNADPTSPYSPKVRWNIDQCREVILLLTR